MTAEQFPDISASPLAGCLTGLRVERDDRAGLAHLCCAADFPGFAGHFPEAPVLPAVMQLLAVRLLAEAVCGYRLAPVSVDRLKFKGMVTPGEVVRVKVALKDHPDGLAVGFTLDREEAAIASGTIVYRSPGAEA